MALALTRPTLLDLTRRTDPDGAISAIAEILHERNEVIEDAVWREGNLTTGNKTTSRTSLPTPTWRKINQGVVPSKTTTDQQIDTCGVMEQFAEVDAELARLSGNVDAFLESENAGFIEAMGQEFADTLFYGIEASEPEAFSGFSVRYDDSTATGDTARNIIKLTGTPDTSIWLVGWGEDTIHCIYPKNTMAGLEVERFGKTVLEDASNGSNSGRMVAFRTHYIWRCGLTVRDWRYAVRIQFDESIAVKDAATGPDLIEAMSEAMSLVPNLRGANFRWYMNRSGFFWVQRQATNAVSNSTLTQQMLDGRLVTSFGGIPMRVCDSLRNDEDTTAAIT